MKNIDYFKVIPGGMKKLIALEDYFKKTGLDPILVELIKIRASQLNGCAYCLNMHTVDALKLGESERRIFLLNAWWESEIFTDREKAVLDLTEHLTKITSRGLPREIADRVLSYFDEEEFANLVMMICQINTWNRLNIAINRDLDPDYS